MLIVLPAILTLMCIYKNPSRNNTTNCHSIFAMRDVRNLRFETEPIRQSSPQTVTAEWGTESVFWVLCWLFVDHLFATSSCPPTTTATTQMVEECNSRDSVLNCVCSTNVTVVCPPPVPLLSPPSIRPPVHSRQCFEAILLVPSLV